MKARNIFALLGLTFAVGAGVAAGVAFNPVKEADAWSGSEMGTDWYIVGTINGQNWDTWNKLTLNGDRYEYTFEDSTSVQFKLRNVQSWDGGIEIHAKYGSDLDWSGKGWTAYTEKADDSSAPNFKTKEAAKYTVYFDKNIEAYENGVWAFGIEQVVEQHDPSSETNVYYVLDNEGVLGETLANVNVYGYGQAADVKPMEWPGTHTGVTKVTLGKESVYRVELSVDYPGLIMNCGNGQNQTEDCDDAEDYKGQVMVIGYPVAEESKVHAIKQWQLEGELTDYPATDGYYVVGDYCDWKIASATKMGPGDSENTAVITGFDVTEDKEYKVKSYHGGETHYYGVGESSENYVAPATKKVNIFLSKSDSKVYVDDYVAPTRDAGIYLVGTFNDWETTTLEGAIKMTVEGDVATANTVALLAGGKVKAIYIDDYDQLHWLNQKADTALITNPLADEDFPIAFDGGGNIEVTVAGNYKIVVDSGEGSMNCKYEAYALDYVSPEFKLKVNETAYDLSYVGSGTQYAAHNVPLAAGDVLSYTKAAVAVDSTAKAVFNNNITSEKKVVSSIAEADVYVDVVAKTIWASGLPTLAEGFHLYVNTTVHPLATKVNEYSQTEYYSTLLTFAADDEIRFIHIQANAAPVIFGNAAVEGGPQASKFAYNNTKGCIVANEACEAALYFKPGDPNNVWFADVSEELKQAKEFAAGFNTALAAVCKSDGTTDKEALWTAWDAQKTAFAALDKDVQDILKAATKTHDVEDIAAFIGKYELIGERYGTFFATKSAQWNFLGKSITPNPAIELNNVLSVESTAMIAIVSVIALASVSAVAALVIYKRRKHN